MKNISFQNKCLAIVGPTASGKSDLAIKLARHYHGVILCADSRQVYKYMNIGTNKPSRHERTIVPHFGLDIVTPDKIFTLSDYLLYARERLQKIWRSGRLPLIVGGTGLYVTALTEGYTLSPDKPDALLRKRLEMKTTARLSAQLIKLSKITADQTDLRNRRRIIRAIERLTYHGRSTPLIPLPQYNTLQLGVSINRADLYHRIDSRVDAMVGQGLIAEVKRLAKRYDRSLPAMSGIGYKQIGLWLLGNISREEAIEMIKRDTRRYAKRQMTWDRKRRDIHWVTSFGQANRLVNRFLDNKRSNN